MTQLVQVLLLTVEVDRLMKELQRRVQMYRRLILIHVQLMMPFSVLFVLDTLLQCAGEEECTVLSFELGPQAERAACYLHVFMTPQFLIAMIVAGLSIYSIFNDLLHDSLFLVPHWFCLSVLGAIDLWAPEYMVKCFRHCGLLLSWSVIVLFYHLMSHFFQRNMPVLQGLQEKLHNTLAQCQCK